MPVIHGLYHPTHRIPPLPLIEAEPIDLGGSDEPEAEIPIFARLFVVTGIIVAVTITIAMALA